MFCIEYEQRHQTSSLIKIFLSFNICNSVHMMSTVLKISVPSCKLQLPTGVQIHLQAALRAQKCSHKHLCILLMGGGQLLPDLGQGIRELLRCNTQTSPLDSGLRSMSANRWHQCLRHQRNACTLWGQASSSTRKSLGPAAGGPGSGPRVWGFHPGF